MYGYGIENQHRFKAIFLRMLGFLMVMSLPAMATTYYLDGSVGTSGDGRSWATAWKSFSNITGLQPGDTVYVSGGTSSQAYSLSDWTPTGGSPGNPVTYAVGQDSGHNGIVAISSSNFLNGVIHDVVINGNVGGAQHWSVTPSNYFWEGGSGTDQNVTLEYITVPNMGAGMHWPNANGSNFVMHNCSLVKTNDSSNIHDFIFYGVGGASVGGVSLYNNYIEFPYSSADHSIGDDVWIWTANIEFYNNTVQGTPVNYTWTQHSDVFQTSDSSNIHVYNNTIIDPGESVFYEDSQSAGTVSSVLIYNNLIVRSFVANGGAQRIFDMNPENGALNTVSYVDMVIANNTVIDQNSPAIFFCRVSGAGSYTRVYVVNNLEYPQSTGTTYDAGVVSSNNYYGNQSQFLSYVVYGGIHNDLHLASNDLVDVGKGRDMSSYFTTDKDGNVRTDPWDIGAYKSGGGTPPAPPSGLTATPQ